MLETGGVGPVRDPLLVVMRGNDVIGRDVNFFVQPIFNEAHHKITKNLINGSIEEISDERAEKLGVFSHLPGAPRRYRSRSPRPAIRETAQNELEI